MGIKNLNRYLLEKCSENAIKQKHLSIFSGKSLVIDTSIYLYKFIEERSLIENMYHMITVFRHYKITPIFVFDGKPPKEKEELIQKRKIQKKLAEEKYQLLKQGLDSPDDIQPETAAEMEKLRRQFIRIHPNDIKEVKTLMDLYGVEYVDAEGEADKVCVKMVMDKTVWACVSDDMDMFVYGTHRVLRYFSLMNHTAVLYNTEAILNKLALSKKEFQEICILSGTDYNCSKTNNINDIYEMFSNFKNSHQDNKDFYSWVMKKHPDVIIDYEVLLQIYNMFDIYSEGLNRIKIKQIPINKKELSALLEVEGFFF